jgi:hypothetical protein
MCSSRRIACVTLLAFVIAAALAGCMRVDRTLYLNGDGSGSYTLAIGFREPRSGDPTSISPNIIALMEAFGTHVRESGGSFQRFDTQGYDYWAYTRPFSSVAEADTLLQEDPRQDDPQKNPVLYRDSLHVTKDARFSSAVFHVTGRISLVDTLDKAQSWVDATETVSITMADGIVANQGGTRRGNTVTYTIHYNQSATIDVEGRVAGASDDFFTRAPYLIAGALMLLAIVLFILGVYLLRHTTPKRHNAALAVRFPFWPLPML